MARERRKWGNKPQRPPQKILLKMLNEVGPSALSRKFEVCKRVVHSWMNDYNIKFIGKYQTIKNKKPGR